MNLKAGDSVTLTELKDGSMRIVPPSIKPKEKKTQGSFIEIFKGMKPETLLRKIISNYLAGYDFVKIVTKEEELIGPEYRNVVRETVQALIGMEIVRQTTGEIIIQCLLDYSKLPISTVMEEMEKITVSMQRDAVDSLLTGNLNLANDVIARDVEVDRLYLLAVKQLKDMIRDGDIAKMMNMSPRTCLGYRVAVKCIERIADHSERIGRNVISLGKMSLSTFLRRIFLEMSETTYKVYSKATEALLSLDENKAEEAVQLIKAVEKVEDVAINELVKSPLSAHEIVCLRTIIDSLKRMADYGTDIAEIVLNLAVGEPET